MKVVHFLRSDAGRHVGGPSTGWVEHLRAQGLDITLWASDRDPPGRYDIGHVWNLDWPVEVARQTAAARRSCRKVVLAPVHHREEWIRTLNGAGRRGVTARLTSRMSVERWESLRGVVLAGRSPRQLPEAARQLVAGVRARQRQVLDAADLILPLARGEEESLSDDFGFRGPSHTVPNAGEHADGPPPKGVPSEFLLCVGRVEARKNQLALLEAGARLDLPVVLAGPPNPRHRAIVRAVEGWERSTTSVTWFRKLPRAQVLALFGAASCHVLPSWGEVVAQVDLEARAAGTRVVTTTHGHMREYLLDDAEYWDPHGGADALSSSIATALDSPRPDPDPDRFAMRDAARELVTAYEKALAG